MIMINSRFYKTLIKTSPKLSNEQLNYNSIIEKINFNINVKAEINTYLSWNKIKEKALCI